MSRTCDGGPAFPTYEFVQSHGQMMAVGGMTLRDYFAAKALQGLLAAGRDAQYGFDDMPRLAESSYSIADEVLKAREA